MSIIEIESGRTDQGPWRKKIGKWKDSSIVSGNLLKILGIRKFVELSQLGGTVEIGEIEGVAWGDKKERWKEQGAIKIYRGTWGLTGSI